MASQVQNGTPYNRVRVGIETNMQSGTRANIIVSTEQTRGVTLSAI